MELNDRTGAKDFQNVLMDDSIQIYVIQSHEKLTNLSDALLSPASEVKEDEFDMKGMFLMSTGRDP